MKFLIVVVYLFFGITSWATANNSEKPLSKQEIAKHFEQLKKAQYSFFDLFIAQIAVDGKVLPDAPIQRVDRANGANACFVLRDKAFETNDATRILYMARTEVRGYEGPLFSQANFDVGDLERLVDIQRDVFVSGEWSEPYTKGQAKLRYKYQDHTLYIEDADRQTSWPMIHFLDSSNRSKRPYVERRWRIQWNADFTDVLRADIRFEISESKGKEPYRTVDMSCVQRIDSAGNFVDGET